MGKRIVSLSVAIVFILSAVVVSIAAMPKTFNLSANIGKGEDEIEKIQTPDEFYALLQSFSSTQNTYKSAKIESSTSSLIWATEEEVGSKIQLKAQEESKQTVGFTPSGIWINIQAFMIMEVSSTVNGITKSMEIKMNIVGSFYEDKSTRTFYYKWKKGSYCILDDDGEVTDVFEELRKTYDFNFDKWQTNADILVFDSTEWANYSFYTQYLNSFEYNEKAKKLTCTADLFINLLREELNSLLGASTSITLSSGGDKVVSTISLKNSKKPTIKTNLKLNLKSDDKLSSAYIYMRSSEKFSNINNTVINLPDDLVAVMEGK